MKNRKELIEQHEHLLKVYEKVNDMLAGYPNVVNVVIGIKEKGGKLTDEGCIKIIVKEKKSEDDLGADEIIPKEVEGVKTDVIIHRDEVLQAVCTTDRGNYRPIKGGIRIGNYRGFGEGTLGCLAQVDSDNSWVLLSNHHVLYGANGQDNDEIGQPRVGCSWCCKTNVIAKNFDKDATLDCAIAKVEDDIAIENIILEIGNIQANGVSAAVDGERVRKRGARTGFTSGTINAVDPANGKVTVGPNPAGGPADDPGGCTNFEAGVTVFTNPGDSGSVYINDNNEIVALHYAGLRGSNESRGNDIIRIQTALNITIKTTSSEPGITPEFEPSIEPFTDNQRPADNDRWIKYVEERLEETATGQMIKALIDTHQKEVLNLVNHHRPVTVTWQRKQGPAFVAAFGRSVKNPEYTIPAEINRVSIQNLLMSMASVLEEYGSEPLRKEIKKYALDVIRVSRQCSTAKEFLKIIEHQDDEATLQTQVLIN